MEKTCTTPEKLTQQVDYVDAYKKNNQKLY